MHQYQHGMDLTLVSQWLGHARLDTTLIYARADTEQKRRAIAEATPPDSPLKEKLNAERFTYRIITNFYLSIPAVYRSPRLFRDN